MKFLLTILFALLLTQVSHATNLRGQVMRYNPATGTYFPLVNVRVDLWVFNGQQWIDVSYAVTGQDGGYFFLNVAPGLLFRVQVFGNLFPAQALTVQLIYPPGYQIIPTIIA